MLKRTFLTAALTVYAEFAKGGIPAAEVEEYMLSLVDEDFIAGVETLQNTCGETVNF